MEFLNSGEAMWLGVYIFVAGFLCTQFLSQVLTLDSLVTFLLSAWVIFFPNGWVTSLSPEAPVDALHEYLIILIALVNLTPALVWFLSSDPSDVTIRTALAVCRLLAFSLTAALVYWEQTFSEMFDPKSFHYTVYTLATVAGVYIIHMFHDSSVLAYSRYGNLNAHLYADMLLAVICAGLCLCVPEVLAAFFGQSLDDLHVFLYRTYGLMTLGVSCLPWIAPRFRSVANKRAVLFSRALTLLVSLSLSFYKYKTGEIPDGWDSKLLMLGLLVMTAPSAIGCLRMDQGPNWDFPWRGLRVPDVHVGLGSPGDLLKETKSDTRRIRAKKRRRSRRRSRRRRRRR